MTFPTSPTLGVTTHTNAEGSVYRYNEKGAWQLIQIGAGYLPPSNQGGALSLLPLTLGALAVGTAVSGLTVVASGGSSPYTYSIEGGALPASLSLNASTGVISGTPSASGAYNVTIRATDNVAATIDRQYTGVVTGVVISISPDVMPDLTAGKAASQTFTASGGTGPYTWAVTAGALPDGLSLNTSTGVVSGTPTTPTVGGFGPGGAAGYSFQLTATDSAVHSGAKSYSGRVAAPKIRVTPTRLSALWVSIPASIQFFGSGGTAPYTFTSSGTLPAGMTLNGTTGILSGTPTTAAAYTFSITATDADGFKGSFNYNPTVSNVVSILWNSTEGNALANELPGGATKFFPKYVAYFDNAYRLIDANGNRINRDTIWNVELGTLQTGALYCFRDKINGFYMAGGVGFVSKNGVNSTMTGGNSTIQYNWCAGNGTTGLVVVGEGGGLTSTIFYSTDSGATFNPATDPFSGTGKWNSVVYHGGLYVASGIAGTDPETASGIFTSTDGHTWTKRATIPGSLIRGPVRYLNNSTFRIMGGQPMKSTNGLTWVQDLAAPTDCVDVAYTFISPSGFIVAVGLAQFGTPVVYKYDLISWVRVSGPHDQPTNPRPLDYSIAGIVGRNGSGGEALMVAGTSVFYGLQPTAWFSEEA